VTINTANDRKIDPIYLFLFAQTAITIEMFHDLALFNPGTFGASDPLIEKGKIMAGLFPSWRPKN
jgi:hypothetical protein